MSSDAWTTSFEIDAGAHSVVGKVREHNEDASRLEPGLGLFAVADGLGGHSAGEHASNLAVEVLAFALEEARGRGEPPSLDVILDGFSRANAAILADAAKRPEREGMGTTLTAALVSDGHVLFGHVGDSRAWRVRDGQIEQLTHDHTVVAQQVREGLITEADAGEHPMRHVLSRCLGVQAELEVDLLETDLAAADVYVLASDGLAGLPEEEILRGVMENDDATIAAQVLVKRACERDGGDNITAVVITCREA